MDNQSSHLSDEELLLWVDGELPRRRAAKIRLHLSACWDCRSRIAQIEATIHDLMGVHRSLTPAPPSSAGPRAQLKARMAELSRNSDDSRCRTDRRGLNTWAAAACLLALTMGGLLLYHLTRKPQPGRPVDASSLPDRQLTPGATTAAEIADLCSTRHDEVVRLVPETLQESVLREYGLPMGRAQNFEIDFLISPGLGGAESIRNLWPEPRYDTVWNSFVKDQLEDYLHQSVCAGRVSLLNAQQEIAGDWISAYQKYFHTKEPLTAVSGLSGVTTRSLTIYPPYGAPDMGEAGHAWIARAKAIGAPPAYRTTNAKQSGKYYAGFTAHSIDLFLWN